MPRRPELSFELKMLIWELAVAVGKKPEVIWRQLDTKLERLREDGKFYEDTPDPRTIRRVIESDIDKLPREFVIEKLPPFMWRLRQDYQDLIRAYEHTKLTSEKLDVGEMGEKCGEEAKGDEAVAVARSQPRECRRPVQVLVREGFLELGARFKRELSCVNVKDYAVWQLLGAPWLSSTPDSSTQFSSVLNIRMDRGKLMVNLKVEEDERFLLLLEWLKRLCPEFGNFQQWKEALAHLVSKCQEMCRELWYEAENRTGLKMAIDSGSGYLTNVPLFVYEFALDNYAQGRSPDLVLSPIDVARLPCLPPLYWQLTPRDRPDFVLAVGLPPYMNSCGLSIIELCREYAEDSTIKKIIDDEKEVQKQANLYGKALSQLLASFY
jgi:hypothetical protein